MPVRRAAGPRPQSYGLTGTASLPVSGTQRLRVTESLTSRLSLKLPVLILLAVSPRVRLEVSASESLPVPVPVRYTLRVSGSLRPGGVLLRYYKYLTTSMSRLSSDFNKFQVAVPVRQTWTLGGMFKFADSERLLVLRLLQEAKNGECTKMKHEDSEGAYHY